MRLLLVPALLGLSACAQLPSRGELPARNALPPATEGGLAERLAPLEQAHPGQSGFRLVDSGSEAFALRAGSAQQAQSSLDVQTYIWHGDLTGRLLARQALLAADRGVRVRLLVDDLDARAHNQGFAALDAHPSIEVRLYNPTASRSGALRKAAEFGTGFKRLNHRMHNKSWIADNRVALVGGRNLGDEYFAAGAESNFVDLDLVMAGPVVRQVSASFDRFWNSPVVWPIALLAPQAADAQALERLRRTLDQARDELPASPYATVLREDPAVLEALSGQARLNWTADWRFVSDDPEKARLPAGERSSVLALLRPAISQADTSLALISPYFVPGENGTATLLDAARRGVRMRILTNSLAATDVAAVHSGYSRYRPQLLAGGVQLWELKPTGPAGSTFSLHGSSGSSLHTKAMVIDDRRIFVGSYNLDPRSTALNCEQGVLVADPVLVAGLGRIFERELDGSRAWQVTLADGDLAWSDGSRTLAREPDASASRRFQAWLMRLLPVESQL